MDRKIKPHVFVSTACISFFVLLFIIGGYLENTGMLTKNDIDMPVYLRVIFGVFIILGFSLVRPFLRLFTLLLANIVGTDHIAIRLLSHHEKTLTWIVWAVFAIGLAVAMPSIIETGFLSSKTLTHATVKL